MGGKSHGRGGAFGLWGGVFRYDSVLGFGRMVWCTIQDIRVLVLGAGKTPDRCRGGGVFVGRRSAFVLFWVYGFAGCLVVRRKEFSDSPGLPACVWARLEGVGGGVRGGGVVTHF